MNALPGPSLGRSAARWWQRVHADLMPDYGPKAAGLWWLVVLVGTGSLSWCFYALTAQNGLVWLQVVAATALAVGAGLFPLRVPGTKNSYAAGEIFIFLTLLLLGPAAAALVAGCEAFIGSYRTSRRWTSRLFSPASAAVAMLATGSLWQWAVQGLVANGLDGVAALLAATLVLSALYFLANATLVSGVLQLKCGEAFFQPAGLLSVFRWVGMAYAGSASLATLLFFAYQQQGVGALLVMVPLLGLLLAALHLYFKQQEESQRLREAGDAAAAQVATLAAREAKQASRHLRELEHSEQRFHSAFTHASIGMALLALDGHILQCNPALCALVGRREDDLTQLKIQALVVPEDRAGLEQMLGLTPASPFEGFATELRCQHASGSFVWLSLHCGFFTEPAASVRADSGAMSLPPPTQPGRPPTSGTGRPCLILQAQDVTARRTAEDSLAHLAFHDSLTGLPNRRRFMECLTGAVARSKADPRHAWAAMFLDFDRFKLVNDSLGHRAGDELLQQLARRLQEKLRPGDILARQGGDEFAILAEGIGHEHEAVVLAERLMAALQQPFVVAGNVLHASASVGITFSAFDYDKAEDVLRDADTAMYKAKSEGKARFAIFDTGLHTAVSRRLRLEGELRQAVERGQLAVEYQPLFELRAGGGPVAAEASAVGNRLIGFEALVRWHHPNGDTLQPTSFLPIAEETGLMVQVSDFVLHCACHQLRRWQLSSAGLAGLTMSVNLAAQDLAHPALVARVSQAIVEAGLRPEHLTLELTEDTLMANVGEAMDKLSALRRLGVQLAVDDFGTGASSLSQLSRLPIDSLKIDHHFVHQLKRDSDDSAVVAAIVQLGSVLRKRVVAEGIESADQVDQLRELGCTLGQGFHLSPPLTEAAAAVWLQARTARAPA